MKYEYQCRCGMKFEKNVPVEECSKRRRCPKCRCLANRIISISITANTGRGSRIPGLCTTLPGEPVYIKNKHHFREECKRRDAGTPVCL